MTPAAPVAIDPNVWSGRVSQEVFFGPGWRSCINVSGLWLERVMAKAIGLRLRCCAPTPASIPIRHGGIFANRASTWPRDHFCRRMIAPRSSRPKMWNEFLPTPNRVGRIQTWMNMTGLSISVAAKLLRR